uniref:Ataxin-2 C-terminal domain-containing protein n=1 Tax=Micrasterias denticulata TaxID=407018 RepID=G4V4D9_9VIRI|nr:hypothetical protein [Micrasterias denticulata]
MAEVAFSFELSSLNPNARDFIPQSFKDVEDFSAEWWYLIQTSPSFREFWTREHGESEEQPLEFDEDLADEFLDHEFLPEEEELAYDGVQEPYLALTTEVAH